MTRVSFFRGQLKKRIGGENWGRTNNELDGVKGSVFFVSKLHECKVIFLYKPVLPFSGAVNDQSFFV